MKVIVLPTNKLKNPVTGFPVVLLSTGAYAPLHDGHVEMMEIAKKELQRGGFEVVGGYLSPDNGGYVQGKLKNGGMADADRVLRCEKLVETSDWLMIDKTSVYYDVDTFFTEVIERLKKQLPFDAKIVYVFGSDNKYFCEIIPNSVIGVCVERDFAKLGKTEVYDNIIFLSGGTHSDKQSTTEREKQKTKETTETSVYVIRDDVDYSAISRKFGDGIVQIIQKRLPQNVTIKRLSSKDQIELAKKLTLGKKTISLDVHFSGDYDVNITRLFSACDGQIKSKQLVSRPGSKNLLTQIRNIPPGDYVLVEDDSSTGETIRRVKKVLSKKGVNITEIILLFNTDGDTVYDVVDMRDFLVGSYQSGLTVKLYGGQIVKAPYCLPYVNLITRAKLLEEKTASWEIWQNNAIYFRRLGNGVRLEHMSQKFIELMKHVGFTEEDTMTDICEWHMDMIRRSYV